MLRRILSQVFPNPALAVATLVLAIAEGLFLLGAPHHVYSAGGSVPWLTGLYLFWFWLTAGWVIWGLARGCEAA